MAIAGDCGSERLGLSDADYFLLTQRVQVIIHSAANVKFNDSLTNIAKTNVRGLKYLIEIGRKCPDFQALVHVSTAFCNRSKEVIKEDFYKPAMDPEKLIELAEKADNNKYINSMLHK